MIEQIPAEDSLEVTWEGEVVGGSCIPEVMPMRLSRDYLLEDENLPPAVRKVLEAYPEYDVDFIKYPLVRLVQSIRINPSAWTTYVRKNRRPVMIKK